jgi:hypothetical protein
MYFPVEGEDAAAPRRGCVGKEGYDPFLHRTLAYETIHV